MSSPEFDERYQKITTRFTGGDFAQAGQEVNSMILRIMKNMYVETLQAMSTDESKELRALESKVLQGTTIEGASLRDIANLFEKSKLLAVVKGSVSEGRLLRAYNLHQVAALSEECSDPQAKMDNESLRSGVKWLLDFATLLLKFKGWLRSELVTTQLPLVEGVTYKQFVLNFTTGVLKNVDDLARNVAFKAATFVTILGFICDKVIEGMSDKKQMAQSLNDYLFLAGHEAGANFGTALSDQLDPRLPVEQKIEEWCRFDTTVGWGKFKNEVTVDEDTGRVSGKVVLENNFLIGSRGEADFNLCALLRGYISGVLEKMLKKPVRIRHDRKFQDCAQFSLKKQSCDFIVTTSDG